MDWPERRALGTAEEPMALPDYTGGSIVNLLSSLLAALGAAPALYAPSPLIDTRRLADARNIVLIVLDGLGYHFLRQQPEHLALRRHLSGRLTSVFPSTTASAITSFMTGVAPQQHGLTGWFTYFKEIGAIAAPLPFKARYGGASLRDAGVEARGLFAPLPLFDKINARPHIVLPRRIVDSDYTTAHGGSAERCAYVSLKQLFERLLRVLRAREERKYVYAYWPEFDSLAHAHGVGSAQVAAHFAEIDAAFAKFIRALEGSGTTVVVTADHGFIDSAPQQMTLLEDHPALAETLALPLCGEPRVAFCYVHAHRCEQFENYVNDELSDRATLFRSEDLLEQGFFGLGEPHPRLRERIGHYTLIMKQNFVIKDWLLGERRYVHVGVHGGVSEQEMHVPLVVFEG